MLNKIEDIVDLFRYKIPAFLSNVWKFRKVLWHHRGYDYTHTLEVLLTSLKIVEKSMKNSNEWKPSLHKKLAKIYIATEILENIIEDNYFETAQINLGFSDKDVHINIDFKNIEGTDSYELIDNTPEEQNNNRNKVLQLSKEMEKNEWNELWEILKGQNIEELNNRTEYDEWFDGSGIEGWWN